MRKYILHNKRLSHKFLSLIPFYLLILVILASTTAMVISAGEEELKRTIQIINPRPDFSLSLRLDKGIGATYAPDEIVRISFRTSNASYVTLFGYDSRGNIRLLFPNQNQKYSLLEANREYYIDYIIERGTTPGIEYIQGFATTEPILITRDMERKLETTFMPILEEDTDLFIQRIRGILTGLPLPLWISSEILHYQVVERRPGTGRLYIAAQPEGADVFLNERYVGQTPLNLEQLQIGEYIVRIELSGYESWERQAQIIDNRTNFLSANLQETGQYGSIAVRCNEDIARIYLDGQFMRLTQVNKDIVLEEVSAGFHDVGITLSGYNDWFQRVEVIPNQRLQLTINLEKIIQIRSLEISCNVDNAMIFLDGNYQNSTSSSRSIVIANIQEGSYELKIVKDGYYDYTSTVRIYNDRISRVNVDLHREDQELAEGAIAIYCNENDARIFVNGGYQTITSAVRAEIINELEENVYEITVIKEGYQIWQKKVVVDAGETTSVFADLAKIEK